MKKDELLHWVILYHSVLSNLYGEERQEALKTIDNDEAFDRFLDKLNRERNSTATRSNRPRTASEREGKRMVPVSQEEYLKTMGKEYGK